MLVLQHQPQQEKRILYSRHVRAEACLAREAQMWTPHPEVSDEADDGSANTYWFSHLIRRWANFFGCALQLPGTDVLSPSSQTRRHCPALLSAREAHG